MMKIFGVEHLVLVAGCSNTPRPPPRHQAWLVCGGRHTTPKVRTSHPLVPPNEDDALLSLIPPLRPLRSLLKTPPNVLHKLVLCEVPTHQRPTSASLSVAVLRSAAPRFRLAWQRGRYNTGANMRSEDTVPDGPRGCIGVAPTTLKAEKDYAMPRTSA